MSILDFSEAVDLSTMGNGVHWHGHVLTEDCHVLSGTIDIEHELQKMEAKDDMDDDDMELKKNA